MGQFSDILEAIRERDNGGYIDPCMIVRSLGSNYKRFDDYRAKLNRYEEVEDDSILKGKMRQEFIQKSSELERLKASYLVAEKVILEIINDGDIQSVYMKDMLNTLQYQLNGAYKAICQLCSEIDKRFDICKIPFFQPEREEIIRMNLLNKLINTTLYHMEEGLFVDNSVFKRVVSDCAKLIRCLENEDYRINDKSVFTYYLMKTMGMKTTQYKCRNCGEPLLNNTVYCLNCYERNV
jgi:hypothetical protein